MTEQKSGVGGWLKFLVVWMIFLLPVLAIFYTIGDFLSTEAAYPALRNNPSWQDYKMVTWTVTAVKIAIFIWAGRRLSTRFQPSSVRIAISSLWIAGPLLSFVAIGIQSATVGSSEALSAGSVYAHAFWALIWTTYLKNSERIANTYYADTELEQFVNSDQRNSEVMKWTKVKYFSSDIVNRRKIFFFVAWSFTILILSMFFDDGLTDLFQGFQGTERLVTWIFIPPLFVLILQIAYKRFVIGRGET